MTPQEKIEAEIERVLRDLKEWAEIGGGSPPHPEGYLEGLRYALDAHGAEWRPDDR